VIWRASKAYRKTLYNWKAKYGGMDVPDARRLKQLEEENAKLKKLHLFPLKQVSRSPQARWLLTT
jgi:hypothetical protein